MFFISTLNHHKAEGATWQKGQTGEAARQLRIDAVKHNGQVSGQLGFNGTTKYEIINGVVFPTHKDQAAFLSEFGDLYNAHVSKEALKPGIDSEDISF